MQSHSSETYKNFLRPLGVPWEKICKNPVVTRLSGYLSIGGFIAIVTYPLRKLAIEFLHGSVSYESLHLYGKRKKTLGASRVLGGCINYSLVPLFLFASPQNGQDYSDLYFSQPSPLRYDPYGAMGLTEIQVDLKFEVQKFLASPLVLLFITFAGFFAYLLILRCRQVYAECANSALRETLSKGVVMLARLEEYVAGNLITDNLESKVEALRERLEKIFCHDCHIASAQEDFNEIRGIYHSLSQVKEMEGQLKLLKKLENLSRLFADKYKPYVGSDNYELLISLCEDIKDAYTLGFAINSVVEQINCEQVEFKELAHNLILIGDFLDESTLGLEGVESLSFLSTLALNLLKAQKPKRKREQKYWKEAKHAAAYILHRVEEVKLAEQEKENIEELSYKDLLERWSREYDDDEMYETSQYLKNALQSDSSS